MNILRICRIFRCQPCSTDVGYSVREAYWAANTKNCLLVLTNVKLPFRSKYFQQKARKRDLTSDHVSNYMGSISQNVLRSFSLPSLQMWEMFIKGNLLYTVQCTYRGNDGPWNIHRTCFTGYIFIYLM